MPAAMMGPTDTPPKKETLIITPIRMPGTMEGSAATNSRPWLLRYAPSRPPTMDMMPTGLSKDETRLFRVTCPESKGTMRAMVKNSSPASGRGLNQREKPVEAHEDQEKDDGRGRTQRLFLDRMARQKMISKGGEECIFIPLGSSYSQLGAL